MHEFDEAFTKFWNSAIKMGIGIVIFLGLVIAALVALAAVAIL